MKKLKNIKGIKLLGKREQKSILGGIRVPIVLPCNGYPSVELTNRTTEEECNGIGEWVGGKCYFCL